MASPTAAAALEQSTHKLLPGQSPPLANLTDTDKCAIVVIAAALCLAFSVFSMAIRAFVRQYFHRPASDLGWDDMASITSMATMIVQSAFVFVQVRNGLGNTIHGLSAQDVVSWQQSAFICDLLYIFILWLTKCSVVFLFIRLTPDSRHVNASYVVLGLSTILMFISELLVAIRCDEPQPWIVIGVECRDLIIRWQAITAFDVVVELLLFGISLYMLHGLNFRTTKKLIVLSAFALRLPVIIPAIFRLHWLEVQYKSLDPTLDGVLASVFTQIQLSFAIFATTSPILRTFMTALNTHYGGPNNMRTAISSHSRPPGKSPGQSISLNSPVSSTSPTQPEGGSVSKWAVPQTRWDNIEYSFKVTASEKESKIPPRNGNGQRSISKATSWAVDRTLSAATLGGRAV
ncbi:hypothetical protein KVR01_008978 [Diaporthe batatas]|uniref:uncharacterized protein n=1 Tax=Diaporthe batatas TaxID=748121 RepID=UPI001D03A743|nr:uncharacterized protein KVR01_008978 [Diaporthe batatas]KAG8160714.1 hypothetical protein KVR01_008978 [Diaporthe batatas]